MKKAVQLPRPKFLAQNISAKVCDSQHFLKYAFLQSLPFNLHNERKSIMFGINLAHIFPVMCGNACLISICHTFSAVNSMHYVWYEFAVYFPIISGYKCIWYVCFHTSLIPAHKMCDFGHKISSISEKFPISLRLTQKVEMFIYLLLSLQHNIFSIGNLKVENIKPDIVWRLAI